jgi:ribonuclease J
LAKDRRDRVAVIPLGGLGEIGKNMMAIVYQNDIVVIDAGLAFPEDDMLGVDFVIPDISYLMDNRDRVQGILLTHGHEDHIGGLSYVLKDLPVPIFATRLTMGLIKEKLAEHGLAPKDGSREIRPGESFRLGPFQVEPFRVNHSIPDAVGFAVRTPVGTIVHTGDFKFDQTPVDGQVADFQHIAEIGRRGVLLLLSDSTNAERPGWTGSEASVGKVLDEVIASAKGRVLVASFASNVHRMQQVINAAHNHNRKVCFVGRSMENVVQVASGLGYLSAPDGTIVSIEDSHRFPANQLVIMTTGSQGEPMAALSRMAAAEHRKMEILAGDTVVIAATPIPGNEKSVARTIDNLYKRGATVVYSSQAGVHVSGHASQEEQKLMLNLIRPKFFIPVHGEFRHLIHHARLAESVGIPKQHILIGENGTVFEVTKDSAAITGKVPAGNVLVDGLGVGDVGNIVLRDRKVLAEDGVMVVVVGINRESQALVAGPDIVSRGFVYVRESDRLIDEAKSRIRDTLARADDRTMSDWSSIKGVVRESLSKFLFEKTRRRPMIRPIVVEL